ncbi:hypothetical protein G4B88_022621 [Cannabis sativa]|uniref:Fumarylacetoacetase n=1 Tax=Cannabis sativa TaxID=3483 RepID=A0A7J6HXS8_CANSA|nr:hypothetical protein G4B88_022621 [Cannabis sativa]
MALKSFIDVLPNSHFPIQNLPFGVFKPEPSSAPRPGVAIGDYVLDLSEIASAGLFDGPILKNSDCFQQPNLNKLLALGRPAWKESRITLQKLLSSTEPKLRDNANLRQKALVPMNKVELLLPIAVGDYTDFFSSMHHAKNCGTMFRGPENAIPPNWFHLPIAYHGRASSVVISGTDIIRPRGQGYPSGTSPPYFGPTLKLDYELEMAAVVGSGNELGKPVNVNEAADHIFGLVLMNDWSARDIQAWEYVPLGPFLGKSFGTTISPWIVSLEALEPFACAAPKQDPLPLPYLAEKVSRNYDIQLEVEIKPAGVEDSTVVTKSNFKHLYWTLTQQIAHHTINGCNLRPGDILGTGTISGPEPDSLGCLLELSWNGQKTISLKGATRKFLEDGDEVIITGFCKFIMHYALRIEMEMNTPLGLAPARGRLFLHCLDDVIKGSFYSTTVTYTFHNDQTTPTSQSNSTTNAVPVHSTEAPIPITVHLPQQTQPNSAPAATKIQSAYRAHRIRTLHRTISSVDSAADELQRVIQRQDTVDAIRSDEREKLRMNEALMALLLRLDSVPGWDPAVREARRKVSRRIVGMQEILDAITESKVEDGQSYFWGYDGFTRNWDEVLAEMEEDVCKSTGGDELERFCAEHLGFHEEEVKEEMEADWRDRILFPFLGIISFTTLLYLNFSDQLSFPVLWQPKMAFVGTNSTHFVVAEDDHGGNYSEIYVNGWNSYWLMEKSIWVSSRSKVSKMLRMGAQMGLTVCRTWAFSDGYGSSALQTSPGVFNERVFRALDYVIVEARKNKLRLILSLVNNLNAFGGKTQYVRWAEEAGVNVSQTDDSFFSHPTVKDYYKAYIKAILTRKNSLTGVKYSEDPAIFAWELINEPRCLSNSSAPVLQAWITEMAAYVKSLDEKHLLTVGIEGFYGPKTTERSKVNPGEWAASLGSDFIQNSAIDNIDFASVHAYPDSWIQKGDSEAKMNFLSRWVDSHISDGEHLLKKPVLITEFGSSLRMNKTPEDTNLLLKTVYDRVYESAKKREAGAGALIWQLLVEGVDEYADQFSLDHNNKKVRDTKVTLEIHIRNGEVTHLRHAATLAFRHAFLTIREFWIAISATVTALNAVGPGAAPPQALGHAAEHRNTRGATTPHLLKNAVFASATII